MRGAKSELGARSTAANDRTAAWVDGRPASLQRSGILNYEWTRKARQVRGPFGTKSGVSGNLTANGEKPGHCRGKASSIATSVFRFLLGLTFLGVPVH